MRKWRTRLEYRSPEGRPYRFKTGGLLSYRPANEIGWRAGTIENISGSGVMFRVEGLDGLEERNTLLELSFTVPREIGGHGDTRVFSRAYIKRIIPADGLSASPALAVSFTDYMLALE